MSDIETNSKLEGENDHNTNSSNEQILIKKNILCNFIYYFFHKFINQNRQILFSKIQKNY